MRPNENSNNPHESALDFLWLVVMIVAGIVLIWYFGKAYIATAVFYVRSYEIAVIDFVLNGWRKLATLLPFALPVPNLDSLQHWQAYIATRPKAAEFNVLASISTDVGSYLRYPIIAVLGLLSIVVYFSHLSARFQTVFNMKRLRDLEKQNWPQINPITKHNLVKEDVNKGAWAMAMTPMDFAKQHKLIKESTDENGKITVSLNKGAASRVFALQLGPVWRGVQYLPIHIQALYVVFAARANREREVADKFLKQISLSSLTGKLDFTGVSEAAMKYANDKAVQKVIGKHAYVLTVMASLLELARNDGVFATSDFLWLKPVDRRLWYMLNTVGRQTAVPEVAGVYAHWITEHKIQRPLLVPMIDEAVKGLEIALNEIVYEPEED